MAIYKVQGPNGEIIEIEGPENANPNDVIAQAQMLYKPQQAAATSAKQDTVFSSTGLPAKAMGAFETGLGAVSGALAVPASAAAGIYGTLTSGKYGTQEGIREGDKLARQVQERMTYRPTTQAGQDIAESAAKVLEASKLPPMIAGPTGIVGLGGAGPQGAFKQGAQRATQIAGNTAMFVPEVAAGALGRGSGVIVEPGATPKSYQVASQRNKVGSSFVEPREFSTFEQGRLPYGQLPAEVPIGNLTANPIDKAALVATGGSVPNAGRGARAFGERIGETYRNPFYAAADIASMFNPVFPGLPLITAGKAGMGAVQALADMRLAGKGFTPNLPQILDDYKTGARPMPRPMPGPEGPMPPMQQFSPGPMPAAGAVRSQTPPTPQTMAAAQINPAMATTPAAQAAVNTTQAKAAQTTGAAVPIPEPQIQPQIVARQEPQVQPTTTKSAEQITAQTQKNKQAQQLANQQRIEKMTWEAIQQRIANGGKLMFNEQKFIDDIVAKYGDNPFGTGTLTARTIKTETPAVKTPVIETPEAAAVRTADDVMREFKDQQRGIVRGDTTATRQNFMNNVEEVKQSLIAAREENKAKFGDRAKIMNPNAGQGSKLPNPKDSIDEKAVVRHMIKQTGVNGVRQNNKQIIVSREGYNDLARQMGVELDWTTAPDVKGMGIADARKKMNTWTFNSIDQQFPELGLKARKESMSSQQRRAEKELGLTDTTPAIDEDAALMAAAAARMNKLTGKKSNKPPGVMEIMTKDGPESMYSYKGILDDIEQASHSVMQQNLKNGGKGFSVSYKHGEDFIHEHKHSGYHKVEIEHPNGTMSTITKMEGQPYMTAKVDVTGIPRNQKTSMEKPANWMSVEDEVKKYFGNE